MSLPFFQYLGPTTKEEALSVRGRHGADELEVVAGGTEILGRLKQGLSRPDYVMSLKNLEELRGIAFDSRNLTIGSGTTLREIIRSEHSKRFSAMVEAASAVAAPPIQNVATIGGNILQQTRCLKYNQSQLARQGMEPCFKAGGAVCNVVQGSRRCFSVYQGDLAPVLIAFEAQVKIEAVGSTRTVSVSELFTGHGEKPFSVADNELLTDIVLPIPQSVYGSSYKKLRVRGALDYPLASAAVFLSFAADGSVAAARVVIGAAGPAPKRVEAAEAVLTNRHPNQEEIGEAGDQAARAVQVAENLPLPAPYRRAMVGVMTKRAIADALQETKRVQNR